MLFDEREWMHTKQSEMKRGPLGTDVSLDTSNIFYFGDKNPQSVKTQKQKVILRLLRWEGRFKLQIMTIHIPFWSRDKYFSK